MIAGNLMDWSLILVHQNAITLGGADIAVRLAPKKTLGP